MSQTDTPEQWREPFPDTEIPYILAAVLRCSTELRKADACEHENRVTIRLARLLVRDAVMLTRPVHLDLEAWEIGIQKAEILGRLDLRYLYSTGALHPWPCFALEAKRLHVTFPRGGWKSLVSEYVTTDTQKSAEDEQGMMCFVTGRYSGGLGAGAMVGYVYDGMVDAALTAVRDAITKHASKLKLSQSQQIRVSGVVPNESRITESIHELPKGAFTIFHLLFGV
jgi:hypothetical protein